MGSWISPTSHCSLLDARCLRIELEPLGFAVFVRPVEIALGDMFGCCTDKGFQCIEFRFWQHPRAVVGFPNWEPYMPIYLAGWRLADANFQLLHGEFAVAVVGFDLAHCSLLCWLTVRTLPNRFTEHRSITQPCSNERVAFFLTTTPNTEALERGVAAALLVGVGVLVV